MPPCDGLSSYIDSLSYPLAYFLIGQAEHNKSRFDEARRAYEKSLTLDPDFERAVE